MTSNNEKMRDIWNAAFTAPGTAQPLGRIVICDLCDKDWTERTEHGGLFVAGHANCPDCEAGTRAALRKYGEVHLAISCAPGMSFADWVRGMRGPDAHIRVTHGKLPR